MNLNEYIDYDMKNTVDSQYLALCSKILKEGRLKSNRTGTNTIGLFGAQMQFDLQKGFPILTTKKVNFSAIVHELLWFISGSTNIKYLVDNGVNIWNDDAYRYAKKEWPEWPFTKEEYIEKIRSEEAPSSFGDLGEGTYGFLWRDFPDYKDIAIDQLTNLVNKLLTNPDDRRMIVSAWHPALVDSCALPPCHCLFQCHTEILTVEERMKIYNPDQGRIFIEQKDVRDWTDIFDRNDIPTRRLNLQMYQRSCDMFLGVPFNITSYSLLLEMLAHCTGMVAGVFTHTLGDYHIYVNHIDQVREQLTKDYLKLPKLHISKSCKDLFALKFEDMYLENYMSHPPIKGELSVG